MKRKILVVEDYDDTRTLMKFMLESLGYKVIEAVDGFQAINCAEKESPDLILMDIAMPGMNGIEATKAIRRFDHNPKIPIICVTAHGKQFRDEALEAGCNDLIGKPLDFDLFETVIEKYLSA